MNKKTWLADSGASSHMTNNNEGMFNIEVVNSIITIGDRKVIKSTMAGSIEFWSETSTRRKTFVLN